MSERLINTGYGNYLAADRIIAIIAPDSAPIKRAIREAQGRSMLVDATYGRKTRAVVVMDSGHIVLCSMQPDTLAHRLDSHSEQDADDAADDESAEMPFEIEEDNQNI